MIEHEELCKLIPHSGNMCLLDKVLEWNASEIVCEVSSHQCANNPLCSDQGLSSIAGIEYGGQVMAVHAGLLGSEINAEQVLYLAAVRNVQFEVNYLHDIEQALTVRAVRLMADANGMIYEFSVLASSKLLVSGRLTVMMSANELKQEQAK